MYPALLKHQIVKPSAFHITRIARASVSGKTQPSAKGSEEYDFESTMKSDLFQEQSPTMKSQTTPEQFSAADIERHKADIYESISPKKTSGFVKKQDSQNLPEQEPNLDEM
ncbi:hypothetical protein PENSUB_12478 [Penicillium subrubescens]|uniref:Uncharacterized protein n=1 Tax=Penicillium subrubescens TaxID=1316194 RepID=A0A1Q5T002_9EURO|nr:hypothetical protein PENSUB_12478 [Penicillium subrubescens]